jgi:hypothetical protein
LVRPTLGDTYVVENAWYREAAAKLTDISDAQVVSDALDKLLSHFRKYPYRHELSGIIVSLRARQRGRKRVKEHVHHMRLLQDVWPEAMKARRKEAETLADCLGDDHDLELLRLALPSCRPHARAKCLRRVRGLVDERQSGLRAVALTVGGRLYAEKPKEFARRIERYWRSWRLEARSRVWRLPLERLSPENGGRVALSANTH